MKKPYNIIDPHVLPILWQIEEPATPRAPHEHEISDPPSRGLLLYCTHQNHNLVLIVRRGVKSSFCSSLQNPNPSNLRKRQREIKSRPSKTPHPNRHPSISRGPHRWENKYGHFWKKPAFTFAKFLFRCRQKYLNFACFFPFRRMRIPSSAFATSAMSRFRSEARALLPRSSHRTCSCRRGRGCKSRRPPSPSWGWPKREESRNVTVSTSDFAPVWCQNYKTKAKLTITEVPSSVNSLCPSPNVPFSFSFVSRQQSRPSSFQNAPGFQ